MHRKTHSILLIIVAVITISIVAVYTHLFLAGYILGSMTNTDTELLESSPDSVKEKQALTVKRQEAKRYLIRLSKELGTLKKRVIKTEAFAQSMIEITNKYSGASIRQFDFNSPPKIKNKDQFRKQINTLETNLNKHDKKSTVLNRVVIEGKYKPAVSATLSTTRRDPFSISKGTPIRAVADGVVTLSGYRKGYGNMVEISHKKSIRTRYSHNRKLLVQTGDKVRQGQKIALMGSTGRVTGTHVHYEILKNGKPVKLRPFKNMP